MKPIRDKLCDTLLWSKNGGMSIWFRNSNDETFLVRHSSIRASFEVIGISIRGVIRFGDLLDEIAN